MTDKEILLKLAKDVMGFYVFENVPSAEEVHAHLPAALYDPDAKMIILYTGYVTENETAHCYVDEEGDVQPDGNIATERAAYGIFWNPLGEIHDAWQLLEAFQKRGTPLLLEPTVFGVDNATAARVISMTCLDVIESKSSVLV